MKEKTLIELIHKRATNQLKEAERRELTILLKDKKNQILASEIESVWEKSKDYQKEYQVEKESALSKLKANIQKEKTPPSTTKVVAMPKRRAWLRVAVAAAILVVGSWLGWSMLSDGENIDWKKVATTDTIQKLNLNDGSKISINSKSYVEYPSKFSNQERRVKLEGEAFFDVAKNPEKPFIIETGDLQIKVLGTSFNIRNYGNEDLAKITVRSGRVEVTSKKENFTKILTKNDQLVFDKKNQRVQYLKDKNLNALAWWSGKLSFENEKMSLVKQVIENTYNVQLSFTKASLLNCDWTLIGYSKSQGVDNLLEIIKASFSIKSIKKVGKNKYQLTGGECKR
ncbi:MAG TPA: FecR family protein [Phaeodactylibacter sp.]|nr:FecR family protein [Phaeodactylibacter sp.]